MQNVSYVNDSARLSIAPSFEYFSLLQSSKHVLIGKIGNVVVKVVVVGDGVGLLVGLGVGAIVGKAVGANVGIAVGAGVMASIAACA